MGAVLPTTAGLRVYEDVLETIGSTPLIHLTRLGRDLAPALYAKVETFNPGGSVKDRIAVNIIAEAERSGRLKPGGTVVESTSGNTGLGLAMVCALRGYKAVLVMPDKMSQEKIQVLRAFGARVVVTPTAVEPEDPRSYYNVAKRIVAETPNAILANQYHNPENPRSHYLTTGPEIWEQTGGKVTDVVATMGTGGTISGIARYLKEQNPAIRIVGVDATGSILLETWQQGRVPSDVKAQPYKVEGFGEDFLPSTLDLSLIDHVIRVTDQESFQWARRLVKEESIFCGGSSGSAIAAARRYAREIESSDSRATERLIVVILPDSGTRYLSKFYDDEWLRENGFQDPEWTEISLNEILKRKSFQRLVTAQTTDRMSDVISAFKEHNISQVPALYPDGRLAGLVTEVDLLKHMLVHNQGHSSDETIAGIVQPAHSIFPASTPLERVLPALVNDHVVMVTENERLMGILTKIDVLDFITQRI